MSSERPDLMELLKEARDETVDQVAEQLRFQRGQITQPLPTSDVRKLTKREQVDQYRAMVASPELALAELRRLQTERNVVRPRTFLRHLARMQRELGKMEDGNGR